MDGPKILLVDIETSPVLAYVWKLWDENVGLNQIHTDWFMLSWSAKWLGHKSVLYRDQRDAKKLEDDSGILRDLWLLLDEADIVIAHNGKRFDEKKINARFILNGMKRPSSFRSIDTLQIAKKNFGFTSNKLAYLADKLCAQKKSEHRKYVGFDLWKACLAGEAAAWKEMEKYNKQDVLALEELYLKLEPWNSPGINIGVYYNDEERRCSCGGTEFKGYGYRYTMKGKFRRLKCTACGKEKQGSSNLLNREKRSTL